MKIFLCHASEDKERVQEIYLILKYRGFEPWMDKPPKPFEFEGIEPGDNWDAKIRKEVTNSERLWAFLSKASVAKRGYVQREFRMALDIMHTMPGIDDQKFLIPIRLEKCDVPDISIGLLNFNQFQSQDVYDDDMLGRYLDYLEKKSSTKCISHPTSNFQKDNIS